MLYHCGKLCSELCCWQLVAALSMRPAYVSGPGCDCGVCVAHRDIHDPVKLAELLAMALRARGYTVETLMFGARVVRGLIPSLTAVAIYIDDAAHELQIYAPNSDRGYVFVMAEIRTQLAAIMLTPPNKSSRGAVAIGYERRTMPKEERQSR